MLLCWACILFGYKYSCRWTMTEKGGGVLIGGSLLYYKKKYNSVLPSLIQSMVVQFKTNSTRVTQVLMS